MGRKGLGSVYVWAAGNGGRHNDNCNCDGYTASIYTITIGGVIPGSIDDTYSERCSAILASTFRSGVVTSDIHNECTYHHTGTSASAPQAAAIVALTLEANPRLTWRDIQYLIAYTSESNNLRARDWQKNGNDKVFSHNYGFGLMNAGRMVELAMQWYPVGPQLTCKISYPGNNKNVRIVRKSTFSLLITKQQQKSNQMTCRVNYLEHVISHLTLIGGVRGKIEINLISPYNTTSRLLELRRKDTSRRGFAAWPFMTVFHWGEQPFGMWRLELVNFSEIELTLKEWHLEFFGVEINKN